MLSVARCLSAIAACTALSSCGRIGVTLLPDDFGDAELGAGADELDGASAPALDASADAHALEPPDFPMPDAADASEAPEAMVDAAPESGDAATEDAAVADATIGCGGARALDLCWYLSARDSSCQETCNDHGGYDARMVREVGTPWQGGSARNCETVLYALGRAERVTSASRVDGRGLGCYVRAGQAWWLSTPDFSSRAAGDDGSRIACACLE